MAQRRHHPIDEATALLGSHDARPGRLRHGAVGFAAAGLLAGIGGTLLTTTPAGAATPGTDHATVVVESTHRLGLVLAGGSSRLTLYHLTTEDSGKIRCTGSCAAIWPPLTVEKGSQVVAGAGLKGSLGTIRRPGGALQVTYGRGRWPLYTYSGDRQPGQASGEGIEGIWFAVKNGEVSTSGSHSGSTSGAGTQSATRGSRHHSSPAGRSSSSSSSSSSADGY